MDSNGNCACNVEGKKKVGEVTPEERDEIKLLFDRKNGLTELFRALLNVGRDELEKSPLYEKIVKDIGEVSTRFQKWWDDKSTKYDWENIKGYKWEIDFNSCSIFLKRQE
jgi:CXXX repeat modification system protein